MTAPCVRAKVLITVGDARCRSRSDRGGYLDHRVVQHDLAPGWRTISLRTEHSAPVDCDVPVVGPDAEFGLVSDIDDTVLTTWLPRPMIAAWNSFVRDESNRQSIPGMARFYHQYLNAHPGAPMIFLSTGAWNTYDFLTRFLQRTITPGGRCCSPIGARPTPAGSARAWSTSAPACSAWPLIFPTLDWLLVGDDGQHDPEIYAEFAHTHPTTWRRWRSAQLSPAEQVLAHGTNMPLDEADASAAPESTWVEAQDGRGLAAGCVRCSVDPGPAACQVRLGGRWGPESG